MNVMSAITHKLKPFCSCCNSENVNVDANAEWDFDKQEWVLRSTFDDCFCCDCEQTTSSPKWVECSVSSA